MKRPPIHPYASSRWKLFWQKYRRHRPFTRASRLQRMTAIFGVSCRTPFYWLEDLLYRRRLERQEIENDPIFIVGHWRSGTTHLHNLLSQDEQFAYLNFTTLSMSNDMLIGRFIPIVPLVVKLSLPKTRPMDSLAMDLRVPQEEEMALAGLNEISYYNCYAFPGHWQRYFDESIAMSGLDEKRRKGLEDAYRKLVRKLNYFHRGKPLIFKNPPSTARLTMLKEIFPGAKFVHIRRNPYSVYASSRARLLKMVSILSWTDAGDLDYDDLTTDSYRILMQRYFEQRRGIPESDLLETSYEELTENPEKVIATIYEKFGLSRSEQSIQNLRDYLDAQKSYRKNSHKLTRAQLERIESEWDFALREWDYELPPDLEIVD